MFKERIRLPLVFLVSPKTFFRYILKEITLIHILLIHCKLYAAAVISLQFIKKNSNISIFVLWLSSSSNFGDSVRYINISFKPRYFSAYCSWPLKQSWLNFSNPKQTGVRIQFLKIDCGRSLFSYISCARRE